MPDTVNTIVSKVQERFADANSTAVIDYINRVNRDVLNIIPEAGRSTFDIDIVADTESYSLPADTIEIAQVLYVTDNNTAAKLTRTSQDRLIEEQPTWEFDAAGTPTQFYVQGDNCATPVGDITLVGFAFHRVPDSVRLQVVKRK